MNNQRVQGLDRLCNCNLCNNNFDYDDRLGNFTSSITGTSFSLHIRNDNNLPPCKLDCVIYLITCSSCKIQYVGKTKQKLKQRFSGHKYCCKMKKDQILYKHFNSDCKFENAKFKIIDRTTEYDLLSRASTISI